ncbi:MAG: hypothetical protein HY922_05720 [Elusimicrobia bacterium]|nr:hypothetical protein [Elusimicrobiota bacterium]
MEKRWGAAAALTLFAVLFTASASAREVPLLIAPQQEEEDPDVKKGAPDALISMGMQVQDLIVEDEGRENKVAGLDFFIERLQEGIRRTGNDAPRNDILENAARARAELKDSYNGLKEALTFLAEARDILVDVHGILQPAQRKNIENLLRVKEVAVKMHESLTGMETEPPNSKNLKNDPSSLYQLEDQAYVLAPLPERIQQAAGKAAQAKTYLTALRTMHGRVEDLRRKAAELDAAAYERLSERKTVQHSDGVPSDSRSEMVIANVNKRLKETVDKAEAVAQMLEDLSRQGLGMDKAVSDAQQANARIMAARDQAVQSAPGIEKEDGRIFSEFKPPYPSAAEETKKALAAEAERSKKRAQCACRAMHRADSEAQSASESAKESLQQAKAGLQKVVQAVGDRSKDELTAIASDVRIDVPAPRQGLSAGRRSAADPMQKSKPVPPDFRRGLEAENTAEMMRRQLGR